MISVGVAVVGLGGRAPSYVTKCCRRAGSGSSKTQFENTYHQETKKPCSPEKTEAYVLQRLSEKRQT